MTRYLLTAGGTGGHMFPAMAVAEALAQRGDEVLVVTDARGAGYSAAHPSIPLQTLPITALAKGKGKALVTTASSLWQAYRLLRSYRPAMVVGFGGYPALPVTLLAGIVGIPLVLHEQNAVMGRANRLAVNRATGVAAGFPDMVLKTSQPVRVMVTGNPVREAFLAKRTPAYTVSADKPLHILITGGSQGAKSFSTLFPAVMERLSAEQRRAIVLTQQCRAEDIDAVRDAYARLSVDATLATFFHDMPEQIATCDLFIGRAGASTIAEVTTIGRAGVYIPYPYAMDDHQAANAARVVAAGAGWLYRQAEATPEALTALITTLQVDRTILMQKAQAAAQFAHVDAVKSLVNLLDDSLR